MRIVIIGAGSMAEGIATRALTGSHSVGLLDRNPGKAAGVADELRRRVPGAEVAAGERADVAGADVVVLALPYPAGKDVAAEYGQLLDGRVVVDISNPVDFATFDSLTVPAGTSAAEEIAHVASAGARVVKAFNTNFAATLVAGEVAGTPLDVFIAGDDPAAKRTVADLVTSGGMRPLDAGPLRRARELEGFQLLQMAMQETLGTNWASAVTILP
ncbi:NADPH-dependent F420 reductase [Streptomyces sp. NPDC058459]|uniref:NADPH-dependent F420 reductase n=1 Tax=Streptomyces sp. NPDC058459 TaxID=3346508 RepID=UPI0036545E59